MGWFFGFKLHIVINHLGELLAFKITSGNVSDSSQVQDLSHRLWGKLIGDRGYISSKLLEKLLQKGVQLITKIRSNFLVNMLSGLAAYCLYENKPKIRLDFEPDTQTLLQA